MIITPVNKPSPLLERLESKPLILKGTVLKNPENRKNSTRFFIEVRYVRSGNKTYRTDSNVVIYCGFHIYHIPGGTRIRINNIRIRRISSFKNPGTFDIRKYYSRKNIFFSGFIGQRNHIGVGRRDKNYSRLLFNIENERLEFSNFVRTRIRTPAKQIINALSVGAGSSIPARLRERFTALGISHIFAISGLHVGFVAFLFYSLIKWLLKRSEYLLLRYQVRRLSALLTLCPVVLFTAMTGFSTSAVRAMIMVIVYLSSIIFGRREFRINTLALAAVIILLKRPLSLFELSFRLSFFAVAGILIVHNYYPYRTGTFSDRLITSIKVTSAATFCTLPFTVNAFGYFPFSSVPANLMIIPLIEILVMPMSVLSLLCFHISKWLTIHILEINSLIIKHIVYLTSYFEKAGLAYFIIPRPDNLTVFIFFVVGTCILFSKRYKKLICLAPLLTILIFIRLKSPALFPETNKLSISCLDSGYKNVYMIQLPGHERILLNGGYSYYSRTAFIEDAVVIPYLLSKKIINIDYFVLTSLDTSHLNGAVQILKKIGVRNIWTNGSKLNSKLWELIDEKNIHWKDISRDTEGFGMGGVQFQFIKPRGNFKIFDYRQPLPIVIKLKYGNDSFLLGESLDNQYVQMELIDTYNELIGADVIFIPSKNRGRTSEDFIRDSGAKYIVCKECRRTSLETKGNYKILKTDLSGMITFESDGKNVRISSYSGKQ